MHTSTSLANDSPPIHRDRACHAPYQIKPYYKKPMKYHSSVDSMANPQIFVVSEGVAVYPAYVISFTKA